MIHSSVLYQKSYCCLSLFSELSVAFAANGQPYIGAERSKTNLSRIWESETTPCVLSFHSLPTQRLWLSLASGTPCVEVSPLLGRELSERKNCLVLGSRDVLAYAYRNHSDQWIEKSDTSLQGWRWVEEALWKREPVWGRKGKLLAGNGGRGVNWRVLCAGASVFKYFLSGSL